jgi:hypothetical protein
MSSFQISKQSLASAALAVTLTVAGAPAQAALTTGPAIEAVIPVPAGVHRAFSIAQPHDGRLQVAIQWSGSNGGDDTPFEDHPF